MVSGREAWGTPQTGWDPIQPWGPENPAPSPVTKGAAYPSLGPGDPGTEKCHCRLWYPRS